MSKEVIRANKTFQVVMIHLWKPKKKLSNRSLFLKNFIAAMWKFY